MLTPRKRRRAVMKRGRGRRDKNRNIGIGEKKVEGKRWTVRK